MKKYKEWLTNEIEIMESETSENYPHEQMVEREVVLNLINQLDEPEALSIDKERLIKRIKNYIPLHDKTIGDVVDGILEIVKELPEMEVLSPEWIKDNTQLDMNPTSRVVPAFLLENLLVPKQEELETKIQELIESYKQEEDAYSNPENGWISGFIEDLKNLVEKEQKYYVLGKYGTPILYRDYRNRITEASNLSDIYPEANSEDFEFTEQEIKDYDERYFAFAVPVEATELF